MKLVTPSQVKEHLQAREAFVSDLTTQGWGASYAEALWDILSERAARTHMEVGDLVQFTDSKKALRVAHVWDEGFQVAEEGSFSLGIDRARRIDDYGLPLSGMSFSVSGMSFSGTLLLPIPHEHVELTSAVVELPCWVFKNFEAQAYNAFEVVAPCLVFRANCAAPIR